MVLWDELAFIVDTMMQPAMSGLAKESGMVMQPACWIIRTRHATRSVADACKCCVWRLSLVQIGKVIPQDITQPSELSSALVGKAKLERSSCCHGIQGLQPGVVPEDVQNSTVGLPQELEPGCDMLPVNPILQDTATVSWHDINLLPEM